jgi:hypothetical protein
MKPTPDLFNLIKSLTKHEKRYVTLFLSSGFYTNNKSSLQLFKGISRQSSLNEAALKKQAGKSAARFSAEKNKLFDLVLESLMFLYRDSLPERRITRNRWRAWILFQKGLPAAAWKCFHKARTMAKAYEFFPHLGLLAYHENHAARIAPENAFFSAEKFHARDSELLRALNTDLVLHTLFTEIFDLYKRYGNDARQVDAHLERIIAHPLLNALPKPASFSAVMSQLEIRGLYYSLKNNYSEAYRCYHEMTTLAEKSKIHLEANYGRYCNALASELMYAVLMREYPAIPSLVQKIRKAGEGMLAYFSYDNDFNDFAAIALYELISWRNCANATTGSAMLVKMEKQFLQYRQQLSNTLTIGMLFLFGTYHFYLGNLKKALHYLNELIDSTAIEIAPHFQCMARMVKLLLHYDLGHYDLLPSLCQSTMRLLRKNNRLGPFEKELLSFCNKSAEGENKAALNSFLLAANKYAPRYYSYGAWSDFDFSAWAESHAKNKPLAQLIAVKEFKTAKKPKS